VSQQKHSPNLKEKEMLNLKVCHFSINFEEMLKNLKSLNSKELPPTLPHFKEASY
jgi:hypothetical protein